MARTHDHVSFHMEFVGRVGPSLFAASLVGCLLSERYEVLHGVLMAAGLGMLWLDHWWRFHGHEHDEDCEDE